MEIQTVYSKKVKSPYGVIHMLTIEEILDDIGEDLYNEILLAFESFKVIKANGSSVSHMYTFFENVFILSLSSITLSFTL